MKKLGDLPLQNDFPVSLSRITISRPLDRTMASYVAWRRRHLAVSQPWYLSILASSIYSATQARTDVNIGLRGIWAWIKYRARCELEGTLEEAYVDDPL